MGVAVLGMVIYSWAVEAEKQPIHTKMISNAKTSLTEEEIRLLKEGLEIAPLKDVELAQPKQ